MIIIGVDFHPSVQQVAYVDTETGETCERRLNHSDGEAERFAIWNEDRSGCGSGSRPPDMHVGLSGCWQS
jgi:hypothetical protein